MQYDGDKMDFTENIKENIIEHQEIIEKIMIECLETIKLISNEIVRCYKNDGKLLIFGNGGSAADAQHFAAELVNRFKMDRRPLSAIALSTDTSILTSIGNDYGFNKIFEKQIEAHANEKDIVIAISTSGKSENVIYGLKRAKEAGAKTVGFTNYDGGEMKDYCDILLKIPSKNTPRVQEGHELVYHIICDNVEKELFG
jgi:D-sedoheptulose 7-phosphate isomerase